MEKRIQMKKFIKLSKISSYIIIIKTVFFWYLKIYLTSFVTSTISTIVKILITWLN